MTLELRLLGNFNLTYNKQAVGQINGSARLQSLLAYLVLNCDTAQPRQQIAFLFWPESSERQARTNLRKLLLQLRRALPDVEKFLLDTKQTIQWNPNAPFWLDVAELQTLLGQLDSDSPDQTILSSLSDLYGGVLLPNCYEEWVLTLRQHLHDSVTRALEQLVMLLETRHAYEEGIRYAQHLLSLDPLREQIYWRLIRLHALAGDRIGALRTYQECVAMLRQELDVEPTSDLKALVEQIQAGVPIEETTIQAEELSATDRSAALHITSNDATQRQDKSSLADDDLDASEIAPQALIRGLPAQTTPCIGRAEDIERLIKILDAPYCRLLTLYGPGGIGKTRLVISLAEEQINRFRHGVYFVPLVSLSTPENIAPAIAGMLNLRLVEGRRPEVQLLAYLRDKHLLLVLDNAEHLLTNGFDNQSPDNHEHLAGEEFPAHSPIELHTLVENILDSAPAAKIVVTSRELLDLYDEHTYEVNGLPLLDQSAQQQMDMSNTLSAAESLFYHQLTRIRLDLLPEKLSAEDRAKVTHICQLVGGMPLALELAATQIRTFSLNDIATGIEQNLDILRTRWRGAHRRHQSMRAVIDSSINTLTETEGLCLARLSVFRGGFSSVSAQAVSDTTLDTLDSILHKSLLSRTTQNNTTDEIFGLHPLIRQYAAEKLSNLPKEKEETEKRYYHYYASLLHDGMTRWRMQSYSSPELLPLTRESDNIRAVGQWLLQHGTSAQLKEYFQDLWDLYRMERRLPEVIELLNDATRLVRQRIPHIDAAILAQWERMLGEAYHILGEFEAGRRHFEETLRVLDFPVTGNGVELLTMLQRQGVQQALNRLRGMSLFQRATATQEVDAGALEAIEAYRQLVDISIFSSDTVRLVNGALYALNLAERTGDPSAQALTYGLMCLMTSAVPVAKLGQMYEQLALEKLPMIQEPERQIDIAIYLSAYYAGRGNWSRLDEIVRPAMEKSLELNAYRRWGYCRAIWASMFIYQGQFENGLQAWRDLYNQSLETDSFLFILPAWAVTGMALCTIRLGNLQRGIELAKEGLTHLQGKDDPVGQARCYAALALAQCRLGAYQLALSASDQAMALMGNKWTTNYASLECYSWTAEVYLVLWQVSHEATANDIETKPLLLHDETGLQLTKGHLQEKARGAWKALQKYARIFAIGKASESLIRGRYAWLDGQGHHAIESWQTCIALSTDLGMQYELGCAHWELAQHLPDDASHRSFHLRHARLIFEELNVTHGLTQLKDFHS